MERVLPKVSIMLLAYNHEKYIANAIESVLCQITDFDYEIIIGEDASTDLTREIVVKYQKEYPGKIRLLLHAKNKGVHQNCIQTFDQCTGEYVCWLEGDDFWIDENKLQLQVEYLDTYPEFPMCFTDSTIVDESGIIVKQSRLDDGRKRNLSQRDILSGLVPPVNTMMHRKSALFFPDAYSDMVNGDMLLFSLMASKGDAAYVDAITASYRMHDDGFWSGASEKYRLEQSLRTRQVLSGFYGGDYDDIFIPAIEACKAGLAGFEKLHDNKKNVQRVEMNRRKVVRNIIISGTNFWNPGDDFVRDGVIKVLNNVFKDDQLNFLFYNFNADHFPQDKFSGISDVIAKGDLEKFSSFVDVIVIAGLSAGEEIKDLYQWIIDNNLQDRVYLIGAGYENAYVDQYISQQPEATIFKNARLITGRTAKTPEFMTHLGIEYHHINCPAILSVDRVKSIISDKQIEKIAFSIQLPHEQGIINHTCEASLYELAVTTLLDLNEKYDVEIIAHHKSEYFHFLNLIKQKGLDIPVIFSSFYRDLYKIYPQFDLVVTTRLHASLFANGHGIPGIILNNTDRHTHCLEGFPHSVWVTSKEDFEKAFSHICNMNLQEITFDSARFKKQLMELYVTVVSHAFEENRVLDSTLNKVSISKASKHDLAVRLKSMMGDPEIKESVLGIFTQLTSDYYLERNISMYKKACENKESWFDSVSLLNWYAQVLKPNTYLEVGVRRGRSMAQMLVESPETNAYGFDLWIPDYGSVPEKGIFTENLGPEFVKGELTNLGVKKLPMLTKGYSHETLPEFWAHQDSPQLIDLIYIDGDHTYEGAKRDLDLGFAHLAPGGALVFDDITHPAHPELKALWDEYKLHFPDFMFIEHEHGTGTAIAFKPPFDHLKKLVSENNEPRNHKPSSALPIHFFTIVLNGEPFIRHHIEMLKLLPVDWHWHIIEGVADLKHDTAWSLQHGGKITSELHDKGRSNDGTSAYLDQLAEDFPDNITLYRKPSGEYWDGKLEMVNAPLKNINQACLLWQIDADELWTCEQIAKVYDLFLKHPEKTAAYYLCHYFVGHELVITSRDTYGNNTGYEWLRTWRYTPGCSWIAHEPPQLCKPTENGHYVDLSGINPFRHDETEEQGLIFQHFAYVTRQQLRFKEIYYGYQGAVQQWQLLQQQNSFPLKLKNYFSWVNDEAVVDVLNPDDLMPVANQSVTGDWWFRQHTTEPEGVHRILWLRTDAIGDNVIAASMLAGLRSRFPHAKITVLCQDHIAGIYNTCPYVDAVIGFNSQQVNGDDNYRDNLISDLCADKYDVAINSVYSSENMTDFLTLNSGASITIGFRGDLSNIDAAVQQKNKAAYTHIIEDKPGIVKEIDRYAVMLESLGVDTKLPLKPEIWTSYLDKQYAKQCFNDLGLDPEKTIALFPGGQHHQFKYYDKYSKILNEFSQFKFIILGGAEEKNIASVLHNVCDSNTVDLTGQTSLAQMAEIIRLCRLCLSADSSGAHIATAVGTENIILAGGGHPGRFVPYSYLNTVVSLPLACFGCNWRCNYEQAFCIKDISPEVITIVIRKVLNQKNTMATICYQSEDEYVNTPEKPQWSVDKNQVDKEKQAVFFVNRTGMTNHAGCPDVLNIDIKDTAVSSVQSSLEKISVLLSRSDKDQAYDLALSLAEQNPRSAAAAQALGECQYAKGDVSKAEEQFYQASLKWPWNPELLSNLSVIYWESGSHGFALDYARRAVDIDPGNESAMLNCVHILHSLGKICEAIEIHKAYTAFYATSDVIPESLYCGQEH